MKAGLFALYRFTTIRACLKNARLHLAIALKVTQSWSEFGWRSACKVVLAQPVDATLSNQLIHKCLP